MPTSDTSPTTPIAAEANDELEIRMHADVTLKLQLETGYISTREKTLSEMHYDAKRELRRVIQQFFSDPDVRDKAQEMGLTLDKHDLGVVRVEVLDPPS